MYEDKYYTKLNDDIMLCQIKRIEHLFIKVRILLRYHYGYHYC